MINKYFCYKAVLILLGLFIVPLAILLKKKDGTFLSWFFVWDNLEDGDGSLWLADNRPKLAKKWWSEYYWRAIRNPAWNMRYVSWASLSALPEHVTDIRYEGNTLHKGYRYSEAADKDIREKIWFKFSAVVEGKRRHCEYEMEPISETESRAKCSGWKFYPHLYLDSFWLKEIEQNGFPKYKDRVVYTYSNRIQKR